MDASAHVLTALDTSHTLILRRTRGRPPAPQQERLNGPEHIVALTSWAGSPPPPSSSLGSSLYWLFITKLWIVQWLEVNSRDELRACVGGRRLLGSGEKQKKEDKSSIFHVTFGLVCERWLQQTCTAPGAPDVSGYYAQQQTLHPWVDALTWVSPSAPHL